MIKKGGKMVAHLYISKKTREFLSYISGRLEKLENKENLGSQEEQEYSTLEFIEDVTDELQRQSEALAKMLPRRLLLSTDTSLSRFWKDNNHFIRHALYQAKNMKRKTSFSFKQKDLIFLKEKSVKRFGAKALGLIRIIDEFNSNQLTVFDFTKKFSKELGRISGDIRLSKRDLSDIFGTGESYISTVIDRITNPSHPRFNPNFKFSMEVLNQLSQNLLVQKYSFMNIFKSIKKYETLNPDLKDYSNQQYTIENPEFFSNIYNVAPSYWFGFMSADVWLAKNIYRISFQLATKDMEQLNSFADKVGYARDRIITRVHFRSYKGEIRRYKASKLEFICRPMWKELRELGLFGSKSEIKNVPVYVKKAIEMAKEEALNLDIHWSETNFGKVAHAWLLGFYDGDGTHNGGFSALVRSSSKKLIQEIKFLFGSPNKVLTLREPGSKVMAFDRLITSKGFFGLTVGTDVFKRMLLSYKDSMLRKRPN